MKKAAVVVPYLIPVAFPLLYWGGNLSNEMLSAAGILLLLIGMSGPIVKKYNK